MSKSSLYGSILFFIGCILFTIDGIRIVLLSGIESVLYLIGSVLFLIGCMFYIWNDLQNLNNKKPKINFEI